MEGETHGEEGMQAQDGAQAAEWLRSVSGLEYLHGVESMNSTFSIGSYSMEVLDLRGPGPSSLKSANSTFAGCWSLETILADSDWALPADATGLGVFNSCIHLVGGSGTTWDYRHDGVEFMSIDGGPEGAAPSYLTAG